MDTEELEIRVQKLERAIAFNEEMETEEYRTTQTESMQNTASFIAVKLLVFETLRHLGLSDIQIDEAFHSRRLKALGQLLEAAEIVDPTLSAEIDTRNPHEVHDGSDVPPIPFPPRE